MFLRNQLYFLVIVVISSAIQPAFAQPASAQTNLKCVGPIPDDFSRVFREKFNEDFERNQTAGGLNKKESMEFAAMTNFYNDNLLLSGSVLYGDELSKLAQSIVDKLVIGQELRKPLRIYTIRSNEVNAYSTEQGMMFITTGLFARLKHESQLAFVLAHEIVHFIKGHSLEGFKDQKDLMEGRSSYRQLSVEDGILTSFRHARQAEAEADLIGFDLYLKAGYDPKVCHSTFDILLRSYLPLGEVDLPWNDFENEHFVLPDDFKIKAFKTIILKEDVDDSRRSHPNINNRKNDLVNKIASLETYTDSQYYQLSDSIKFTALVKTAQFEMIRLYLKRADFAIAYYNIQVLKTDYPSDNFIREAELMCWAGIQMFTNNAQKETYSDGYRDFEGKQQGIRFWLHEMSRKEINVVATRFIWTHASEVEGSSLATELKNQSMRELALRSGLDSTYFLRKAPNSAKKQSDYLPKSGLRQIIYTKNAFIDLFQETEFAESYSNYFAQKARQRQRGNVNQDTSYTDGYETTFMGSSMEPVEKMLMISPRYFGLDLRKSIDKSVLNSDAEQVDLIQRLSKVSSMLPVSLRYLDDQKAGSFNTEQFNMYSRIMDWLREESMYDGFDYYAYHGKGLADISQRYETNYVGLCSIWTLKDRKKFELGTAMISAMFVYSIPFYVYWQVTPEHETNYSFAVFNMKTGNLEYMNNIRFPSKYKKDYINSHMYHSLNQISHK